MFIKCLRIFNFNYFLVKIIFYLMHNFVEAFIELQRYQRISFFLAVFQILKRTLDVECYFFLILYNIVHFHR